MVETKTVEFDNGVTVTVDEGGHVVEREYTPFRELQDRLDAAGIPYENVQERGGGDGLEFFVGTEGTSIVETHGSTLMEVVDSVDGIYLKRLWPAYEDGDDTDLALFMCVEKE